MATTVDKNIVEVIVDLFKKKKNTRNILQESFGWTNPNTGSFDYERKQEDIQEKLTKLFTRIKDYPGINDEEVLEDIRYVGRCEGLLERTGDLPKNCQISLNRLWEKYKKTT